MKTIVLPGYSLHNKDWALEIKKSLSFRQSVLVHEWQHWQLGGTLHPKYEIGKILKEIALRRARGKGEKVNVIAKSVGTMICMHLLAEIPDQINKIILCGIPSVSEERKKLFTASLSSFSEKDVVVFQNTKDPLASFEEVKDFMKDVNPKIKVIEKERLDHNYPYFAEFSEFILN
jgi:pimeloyl-ACP methyl ester carboxylesterase